MGSRSYATASRKFIRALFLLNALERSGATIKLFFSYFAYARQAIAAPQEACSACVISTMLNNFPLSQTFIIHPHTVVLHDFLSFTSIIEYDFFCRYAASYDAIAAPDAGAAQFAHEVAQRCHKDLILLTKVRSGDKSVEIVGMDGSPAQKKILLVDDMISTGNTLVKAAHALEKQGAHSVSAAATHGVFAPGARQFLEQSNLEKIYVTNTIAQHSEGKIIVQDISPVIKSVMQVGDLKS